MKHVVLAMAACATLGSTAARAAAWEKRTLTNQGYIGTDLSTPNGEDVFVLLAKYGVDQSGTFPKLNVDTKVYASHDGGGTYAAVAAPWGVQSGTTVSGPHALFFVDSANGWMSVNKKVYRTASAGTEWSAVDIGFEVWDLAFTSTQNGIAVGADGKIQRTTNGGGTWTPVTSGTDVHLRGAFFDSATHGYAFGHDEVDIGSWDAPNLVARHGVVLVTSDAGASWSSVASFPTLGISSVAFLGNGQTGFVAVFDQQSDVEYVAQLKKTTNGGTTWSDVTVPTQVGEVPGFFGSSSPILTSRFAGMHWSDAQHGHLVGSAFLGKLEQGSSGNDSGTGSSGGSKQVTYLYRTVDYVTADGGATWTKTDLGTVTMGINTQPEHDGLMQTAIFRGRNDAFGVSERDAAWRFRACGASTECGAGFACDAGTCQPSAPTSETPAGCTPTCSGATVCVEQACVEPSNDCDPRCGPGAACVSGVCRAVTTPGGDQGAGSDEGGGCASPAGQSSATALVVAALALWLKRMRRTEALFPRR